MALSLVFSENSLNGSFIVDGSNFNILFDVTNIGVQNLDIYLENVPFYTPVASLTIQNPFGGALLYGALYYKTNTPNIQFISDTVFNPGDNIIGIITLNFAYLGTTPIFSNGVFGGQSLTYTIPSPYIIVTNTNPLTITPSNITTPPTIFTYPNPEPCFLENTKILTITGEIPVKLLKDNDEIYVSHNNSIKIDKIKKIIKYKSTTKNLFCLSKNFLHLNDDLFITGSHAIKINNEYRHVGCLFNENKYSNFIKKIDDSNNELFYYHIELNEWNNHSLIANNLEIEPFYENSVINDKWIDWKCTDCQCSYQFKPVHK